MYSTELRCLDEQESQLQAKMDDLTKTMRTTKQERDALQLKRQATEDEYVTGKMRLDIIRETLAELRKDDDKASDVCLGCTTRLYDTVVRQGKRRMSRLYDNVVRQGKRRMSRLYGGVTAGLYTNDQLPSWSANTGSRGIVVQS